MSTSFGAEGLFQRFFVPQYLERQLERRAQNLALQQGRVRRYPAGHPVEQLALFEADARETIVRQLTRMTEAARADNAAHLGAAGRFDDEFLAAFDAHWDKERVWALSSAADPTLGNNDFVVLACELGAALGAMVLERCPGTQWLPEMPYWESVVYREATGVGVDVFGLARQRLSPEALGAPLAQELRSLCQQLDG